MKKALLVCCVLFMCMEPAFAEEVVYHVVDTTNDVTGEDILTILKAIGCTILCFVGMPMLFIALFCAGIRTIRCFLGI